MAERIERDRTSASDSPYYNWVIDLVAYIGGRYQPTAPTAAHTLSSASNLARRTRQDIMGKRTVSVSVHPRNLKGNGEEDIGLRKVTGISEKEARDVVSGPGIMIRDCAIKVVSYGPPLSPTRG